MFLFPPSKWVGGILYEHTHRLWASMVGLLVIALTRWLGGRASRKPLAIVGLVEVLAGIAIFAIWPNEKATGGFLTGIGGMVLLAALFGIRGGRLIRVPLAIVGITLAVAGVVMMIVLPAPEANGGIGLIALGGYLLLAALAKPQDAPAPSPLPQLGWLTFFIVQFQGLLGGLRVVLFKDQIGIFHATLAQIFFVLTCLIALMTSAWWSRMVFAQHATRNAQSPLVPSLSSLQKIVFATAALILFQLILGATMRHQHAGLSIRDFPLAYGKLWPATDPASIAEYNAHRIEITNINPITAFQVQLQMVHRIVAVLILIAVGWCAWKAWRQFSGPLAKISAKPPTSQPLMC
jgi:cytochrome c oxidase assembly protein subunit 15